MYEIMNATYIWLIKNVFPYLYTEINTQWQSEIGLLKLLIGFSSIWIPQHCIIFVYM
jgi:hypothetical protein